MDVTGAARGIREDVSRAAPAAGTGLPALDHIERNRAAWELWAPRSAAKARAAWEGDELRWGIWGTRESELGLLEGLPRNASVVELGCGTASVSAWIARRGLRPVGVDFVRAQLETAAQLERAFGVHFPLLCADVERLHFDQEAFDCAISEYGASLWCEPERWLAEANRILRPGGRLVFFTSSPLLITCTPDDGSLPQEKLVRDYFSRHRVEFPDNDGAIEFHLTHGGWIGALREAGFVLESLVETQPAADAPARTHLATRDWGRRWPTEEIWVARKPD
jgi:SAM-dependent methyltransferase